MTGEDNESQQSADAAVMKAPENMADVDLSDDEALAAKAPEKVPKAVSKSAPKPEAAGRGMGKGGKHMEQLRHRRSKRELSEGLTKPAVRRLIRRAGGKRMAGDVHNRSVKEAEAFLDDVLSKAITMCEHARRRTVTVGDIVHALRMNGRTLYGYGV